MERFDAKANPIDRLLEEKFQLLPNNDEAPEELKEEVFASLDAINFAAEFAGLFTVKFAQTGMALLGAAADTREEKKE
jgi:hypothetical protein